MSERGVRMRSASWLFAAQVAGVLISFPMSILLARVLGPEGKGILSIVQQVAVMSATLFNFGIGAAFIYYAARREAPGRDAVGLSSLVAGIVTLLIVAVFALGGDRLAGALLHEERITLILLGSLAVFPVLVSSLLNCFVVGSGAIRNASLVNTAALAAQLLVYVVLWLLHLLTPAVAVIVWLAVTLLSAAVWIRLSWNAAAEGVAPGVIALLRRVYRYGVMSWISGSLGYVALRQDVFILAYFKGPAAVGVYSVAVTLAELCWYVPSSLVTVLTPKVASSDRQEGLAVTLRLSRMTWPVTLCVATLVWLAALVIVPLLYGQRFVSSLIPLALILPGIVAYSIGGMPSSYLMGTGHPGDSTIGSATNVAVNLLANLLLVPSLGVAGAALSSAISYTAMTIVVLAMFKRRTNARLREALVPSWQEMSEMFQVAWAAVRQRIGRGTAPDTDDAAAPVP